MILELFLIAASVAAVAAVAAFLANKRWPQSTIGQLTNRIVNWLVLSAFILMIVGCALVARTGCAPDDSVCDGPATAAAGVMILGVMIVAAVVLVGAPVAYSLLTVLRRR